MRVDSSILVGKDAGKTIKETGREILERTIALFAKQALRTIMMTYRDLSESEYQELKSDNNDFLSLQDRYPLEDAGLTAVGIWGI